MLVNCTVLPTVEIVIVGSPVGLPLAPLLRLFGGRFPAVPMLPGTVPSGPGCGACVIVMFRQNVTRQHQFHSRVRPREDTDGVRQPPPMWGGGVRASVSLLTQNKVGGVSCLLAVITEGAGGNDAVRPPPPMPPPPAAAAEAAAMSAAVTRFARQSGHVDRVLSHGSTQFKWNT